MTYKGCSELVTGEGCTQDVTKLTTFIKPMLKRLDKSGVVSSNVNVTSGKVCFCHDGDKCDNKALNVTGIISNGKNSLGVLNSSAGDKHTPSSGEEPASAISTSTRTSVSCVECAMARYDTGNQIVNQQISNYMPTMVPACVERSGSLQAEQCPDSKSCVAFHVNMTVAIEAAMLGKYRLCAFHCLFLFTIHV